MCCCKDVHACFVHAQDPIPIKHYKHTHVCTPPYTPAQQRGPLHTGYQGPLCCSLQALPHHLFGGDLQHLLPHPHLVFLSFLTHCTHCRTIHPIPPWCTVLPHVVAHTQGTLRPPPGVGGWATQCMMVGGWVYYQHIRGGGCCGICHTKQGGASSRGCVVKRRGEESRPSGEWGIHAGALQHGRAHTLASMHTRLNQIHTNTQQQHTSSSHTLLTTSSHTLLTTYTTHPLAHPTRTQRHEALQGIQCLSLCGT